VCHNCKRVRCICTSTPRVHARAAAAAIVALAGLLLAGCGGPAQPHGTVVDKDHERAVTHWRTVPKTKRVCTTSRRAGTKARPQRMCSQVAVGTRRVSETTPECWELELDTGDEVCVSARTWRRTDVGDPY
jgi:hypothetical protein